MCSFRSLGINMGISVCRPFQGNPSIQFGCQHASLCLFEGTSLRLLQGYIKTKPPPPLPPSPFAERKLHRQSHKAMFGASKRPPVANVCFGRKTTRGTQALAMKPVASWFATSKGMCCRRKRCCGATRHQRPKTCRAVESRSDQIDQTPQI